VTVLQHTCPGLVAQIEAGHLDTPETRSILEDALLPMLDQGIDTVVLGCTHYPFVIPLIQEITGPSVRVIDPAPAVARQAARLLETQGPTSEPGIPQSGSLQFITTGDPVRLQSLLSRLIGESGSVGKLTWRGEELVP
jgi:glutamate racemase